MACNLFGFDIFFFLKGLRLESWRTRNIYVGGTNLVNINFVNIVNQVKCIDTLNYFQQSFPVLATKMTDREEHSIKKQCEKCIKNNQKFNEKFKKC